MRDLMPGPDFDEWIAENLMKWEPKGWVRLETFGTPTFLGRHDDVPQDTDAPPKCKCCSVFRLWDRADGKDHSKGRKIIPKGCSFGTPPFSSDNHASADVVRKIHSLGFYWWLASHESGILIASIRRKRDSDTFAVGSVSESGDEPFIWADSTPHSICLAAYRVVGA